MASPLLNIAKCHNQPTAPAICPNTTIAIAKFTIETLPMLHFMRQRIEAHILHSIVALNGRNTARETPQTQIIKPQHTFTLLV